MTWRNPRQGSGALRWAKDDAHPVMRAVQALYGATHAADRVLQRIVARMKASDDETIQRAAHVLSAAQLGFGMGYRAAAAIIASGQVLLGHPLRASSRGRAWGQGSGQTRAPGRSAP